MERGTPTEGCDAKALLRAWGMHIATCRRQVDLSIGLLSTELSTVVNTLDEILSRPDLTFGASSQSGQHTSLIQPATVVSEDVTERIKQARCHLDGCLHHLQFQDRTDQILSHVQDSISSLADAYGTCSDIDTASIDFSGLLSALKASYTTREEGACQGNESGSHAPGSGSELTYF